MKRYRTYMDIQNSAQRCRAVLILTASALFFLFGAALSVRAGILLNDNGTVTKDGVSLNNASDALLNGDITSAEFMAALNAKLAGAQTELAEAKQDLDELKKRIDAVLQTKLAAELQTGDGPRAQIIRDLIKESSKSAAQLRFDAAQTAKAAADKALSDAQAALQK